MTAGDRRIAALALLSAAMLIDFGDVSGLALGLALLAVGAAATAIRPALWGPRLRKGATTALLIGLAATAIFYEREVARPLVIGVVIAVAAALVTFALSPSKLVRGGALATAVVAWVVLFAAGFQWGHAEVDVFNFQQGAASAVLHGQNPYTPLFASVVGFGAPGVYTAGLIHFPYGPIIPLLEAPFRLLGDVRVLHMLAAAVTAVTFIVAARRSGDTHRGLQLVMAFPLFIGIVQYSWIDVITMAGFCVWLLCMRSHPRLATIALAISLGGKPTTLIALVPVLFWSARARRQAAIATAAALALVLPFAAMTGFSQFYENVIGIQLQFASRTDSLTLNSGLHLIGQPLLPVAVTIAVIVVTAVLVLLRKPRTYGELLTGTAVLTAASLLVAKWAYYNYYYIAAVLLAMAVAADGLPLDVPEQIRPPALLTRTWRLVTERRRLQPSAT